MYCLARTKRGQLARHCVRNRLCPRYRCIHLERIVLGTEWSVPFSPFPFRPTGCPHTRPFSRTRRLPLEARRRFAREFRSPCWFLRPTGCRSTFYTLLQTELSTAHSRC